MNRVVQSLVLMLLLSQTAVLPALCQHKRGNPMVNTDLLEPTTFHTAPRRLQIVPTGPIVTNCIRPEMQPTRLQFVGSASAGSGTIGTVIPPGGLVIGRPAVLRSNPMLPNLNELQPSQFASQIPGNGSSPLRWLPDAASANHLRGKFANAMPSNTPDRVVLRRSRLPANQAATTPWTPAASYIPINSGQSAVQMQSSTQVSAKLKTKLLKRVGN